MKDITKFERRREKGKPFAFSVLVGPVEEHFANKVTEYVGQYPTCHKCGEPTTRLQPDGERVQPGDGVLLFVRRWRCPGCNYPAVCALEMTAELHEFLEGVVR